MLWRGILSGAVWLLVAAAVPAQAAAQNPAENPAKKPLLRCQDLGKLLGHYLSRHVSHKDLEEDLRKRVAHTYLSRVDPQRSLYLQGEADAIEMKLERSALKIRNANCQAIHDLHTEVGSRLAAEEAFVRNLVGG
ncbi:MAG: hypothetical protein OEP95_16565, partial [Myxococcales bacterium]|nr:hypothetical protein [Myxococcales bacterium]